MSVRRTLAMAVMAVMVFTALPAAAQDATPSVVIEEDFEDLRRRGGLLGFLQPTPSSGSIPAPLTAANPGPFRAIPEGVTISGTDGALVYSRPSTFARPASPTAVNPPGGQAGGVRIDIARDDVIGAELSVQMVRFSFVENPQPAGTIQVTALDAAGAVLDEVAVNAAEADSPVAVMAPEGATIAAIVVAGIDGQETLHQFALIGTGEPAAGGSGGSTGNPLGGLVCGLLGC